MIRMAMGQTNADEAYFATGQCGCHLLCIISRIDNESFAVIVDNIALYPITSHRPMNCFNPERSAMLDRLPFVDGDFCQRLSPKTQHFRQGSKLVPVVRCFSTLQPGDFGLPQPRSLRKVTEREA